MYGYGFYGMAVRLFTALITVVVVVWFIAWLIYK